MIEKNSNGARIDFMGWQPIDILLRRMAEADIVVVPSYSEPFGMVILEAMCLKKPVIVGSSGGVAEIITDRVNGLLVKPDTEGLETAITELLNSSQDRAIMGQNAFITVMKNYSVQKVARQFMEFMDDS